MATGMNWAQLIAIAIVAIVVGGGFAGYLYFKNRPQGPPSVLTTRLGDNVTVNYIGVMGSGAESGKVFDTSLYSVATNGIAYPKSLEFGLRGTAKNYTPLAVHLGSNTPSSGYSLGGLSFIQTVTGFWQGVVGMTGNSTRAVIVPPNLGYGPTNSACVATRPLQFTVPMVETLTLAQFAQRFPGITAFQGTEFPDPHYAWPVLVLSENSSFATIENLPSLGSTASPAGWPVVVTALSPTANGTGTITLTNQLNPAQAGLILGHDYLGTGPCSGQSGGRFIVSSVNIADGTYTENFNQEVQGQTLVFLITVVDIFPSGTLG
ncbi:MAG TPA: FKBP-type peptidyl-prolyl cis-trans isomerase [Thermoplasmata archaeon]|nr:FKBP-type peptidyl-prolyl cis-trans isomerase [Thermoplasmata archaeon]